MKLVVLKCCGKDEIHFQSEIIFVVRSLYLEVGRNEQTKNVTEDF